MNKAETMMQELGNELIRYGYIVFDSSSEEEDLWDESLIHHVRFRSIVYGDDKYHVWMRDGVYRRIELDMEHPVMMKHNPKYRIDLLDRIREKYPDYKG